MEDDSTLSDKEKEILAAARAGKTASFKSDPKPAIQAGFLVDVLTSKYGPIHPKGLDVTGITVQGEFDLQNRKIEARIVFHDCVFLEKLLLGDAELSGLFLPGCVATQGISADGMVVKGDVFLDEGFTTKGEVRLLGADIGGVLSCQNGLFENPDGDALSADGMVVKGDVFLNAEFKAVGVVRLVGADIGGDLACGKGIFENPKGIALYADRMRVKGSVLLRKGFKAQGMVSLHSADLGVLFSMQAGQFEGKVDLRHAKTRALADDAACWEGITDLSLDGFQYDRLDVDSPLSFEERLPWLRKDKTESYLPHPYEQLAKVYKAMGHSRDARSALMEKERQHRRKGRLSWERWVWSFVSEYTIGFGYAPWRAGIWLLFIWMLGSGVFWCAKREGVMVPTKERIYLAVKCPASAAINCSEPFAPGANVNLENMRMAYPRLNPVMYSLDALLPFVDFKQEEYWLPSIVDDNRRVGLGVRLYLWIHIILGWFLASMGVAGVTGIVKKDG